MKGLKRLLRPAFIVLLIVLASIGISLGGGAVIFSPQKQENREVQTELVEYDDQDMKVGKVEERYKG